MAISRVTSVVLQGLQGVTIDVEVDLGLGLPNFSIVGLPDKAVEEAKERVRSALKNSGLSFPQHRLTVNLAPADVRKFGTGYDLPIALGIMAAMEQIPQESLIDNAFLGELSLGGDTRPIPGILPAALHAQSAGWKSLYVPKDNAVEAALIDGITVFPVSSIRELMLHLRGEKVISPAMPTPWAITEVKDSAIDMDTIRGQSQAKRALEIAAAGGHNVLMSGPPGSGKTLLAKAFSGILPSMTREEVFEVTKIYSVAGLLGTNESIIVNRPFRSPHHTSSTIALVGGGQWPRPGEISLAHRGVLFLDEFPEFPRGALESLRQPLEDGVVTVSRAAGSVHFPAKFILIATQNPCPCGYLHDTVKQCHCSPSEISRYRRKVSGPLLDRFDLHITVPRVDVNDLAVEQPQSTSSHRIQGRIEQARQLQSVRFDTLGIVCNAEMTIKQIEHYCAINEASRKLLSAAVERFGLSARSYHRVLKVARTIADLAQSSDVGEQHVAEALQFREAGESFN